jgi:Uma2 family endonuclease
MATVQQKLITAEEFLKMPDPPDGSQQELVRGAIITMPPPQGKHGVCCSNVNHALVSFVRPRKLGWVTSNDAGFISERDPDTVRGPDVAYWSKDRVPQIPEGYFEVPPDLAVEVVSPNDSASKLNEKIRHYLQRGVRMVWVIDPELRSASVYRTWAQPRNLEETESIDGEDVLPGFSCRVADLFGD